MLRNTIFGSTNENGRELCQFPRAWKFYEQRGDKYDTIEEFNVDSKAEYSA